MAKYKKSSRRFSFHKLVTVFAVVIMTAGIGFTVFASQQATQTESEATGNKKGSISKCNLKNSYAGGIQLFNFVDQKGGDRVLCIPLHSGTWKYSDNHLGTDSGGNKFLNIWNFNNKANSFKIRANPGCRTQVFIYDGRKGSGAWLGDNSADARNGGKVVTKFKNLGKNKRNRATSLDIWVQCGNASPTPAPSRFPSPTPAPGSNTR